MAAIVVGPKVSERIVVWLGFPVVGAGLGYGIYRIADWAAGLEWFPFQGPLKLVASLPEPHVWIGALVLGAIAGWIVAYLAEDDYVKLALDEAEAGVRMGDFKRTVPREDVGAVFVEGKKLVLLGHRGQELVRVDGDLDGSRVGKAFSGLGYPWQPDGDPHADEYHYWVEDTPDLRPSVNALLTARAKALEVNHKRDLAELARELGKVGVVVRDKHKRQWWRSVAP